MAAKTKTIHRIDQTKTQKRIEALAEERVRKVAKREEVIRAARVEFQSAVMGERARQIVKWGDTFPTNGFDTMAAVLCEETGEVARAILDGDRANLGTELIQTAAVCCRMYEQLARGEALRSSNKAQLAAEGKAILLEGATKAMGKKAADALANLLQVVEQLIPEPSARGVADVVMFQGRDALKELREAGAL